MGMLLRRRDGDKNNTTKLADIAPVEKKSDNEKKSTKKK